MPSYPAFSLALAAACVMPNALFPSAVQARETSEVLSSTDSGTWRLNSDDSVCAIEYTHQGKALMFARMGGPRFLISYTGAQDRVSDTGEIGWQIRITQGSLAPRTISVNTLKSARGVHWQYVAAVDDRFENAVSTATKIEMLDSGGTVLATFDMSMASNQVALANLEVCSRKLEGF